MLMIVTPNLIVIYYFLNDYNYLGFFLLWEHKIIDFDKIITEMQKRFSDNLNY